MHTRGQEIVGELERLDSLPSPDSRKVIQKLVKRVPRGQIVEQVQPDQQAPL